MSGRSDKIGFFRPIIADESKVDSLTHLIKTRYQLSTEYEDMLGCSQETARQLIGSDRYADLLKLIIAKFRELERHFDIVLCAGTDFKSAGAPLEFDFNIDVANNLGCLIIPVVRGLNRNVRQSLTAAASFHKLLNERDSQALATVINLVDPVHVEALKKELKKIKNHLTYVVPYTPSLMKPTVNDIARALNAKYIYASAETLNREVSNYKVAAMGLPDYLNYIEDGSFIITPGDRADIILGTLSAYTSSAYPQVSGMLLTGGILPSKSVQKLIDGLGSPPVAILTVVTDTFTSAMAVNSVVVELNVENERKIAAALGVIEDNIDLPALEKRIETSLSTRMTPLMFEYNLVQRAKSDKKHIVLPEGVEERILLASERLLLRGVCDLTLLGDPQEVQTKINALGLQLEAINIINPLESKLREEFAQTYFELRKHKGISLQMAFDTMADVSYFGTMMVYHGYAHGMVSGSIHTTQHTIRPALETIKTKPGVKIVSSVFLMCLEDRVLVYGDCAVNPNPTAEQLADIALSSALTAQSFGIEPRIAMLSYSTGESGKGEAVDKVRQATKIAKALRPDLKIDGPLQYDAAVDASVAKTKLPNSDVAGHASVFIFPDLNTGNNTYKAVQRSADAVAIGPVLQGLNKPVNDLSRGCSVTDIINTVAITAIQAQSI